MLSGRTRVLACSTCRGIRAASAADRLGHSMRPALIKQVCLHGGKPPLQKKKAPAPALHQQHVKRQKRRGYHLGYVFRRNICSPDLQQSCSCQNLSRRLLVCCDRCKPCAGDVCAAADYRAIHRAVTDRRKSTCECAAKGQHGNNAQRRRSWLLVSCHAASVKAQRTMRIAASLNLISGSHVTSCSAMQLARNGSLRPATLS